MQKNIEIKDPNIKQLVLLGKTGDGKSTFGNRLTGDTSTYGNKGPFKATNDTSSGMIELDSYKYSFRNLDVSFIFSDKRYS